MNGAPGAGNKGEGQKETLDEKLAKIRARPEYLRGVANKNADLAIANVLPTKPKILRSSSLPLPKVPPQKSFTDVEQPELEMTDSGWKRKEE